MLKIFISVAENLCLKPHFCAILKEGSRIRYDFFKLVNKNGENWTHSNSDVLQLLFDQLDLLKKR
jgi:hypothetical protein